ncbi:MAG: mechanosensitive ion channel [Natrialbaceae archaeon]|nr:mechanosensitive ion channel [Natrialbaceae archaeon]
MTLTVSGTPGIESVLRAFVRDFAAAIPRVISAIVVLALAFLTIKLVMAVSSRVIGKLYPADEQLVVDLFVTLIAIVLWFGAGLTILDILGFGEIAASLGTAVGFIALGIAFALKEMIADTVAGVYLLQDPDFNVGDRVQTADETGTITAIGLRKTRLETPDGELVVLANGAVEQRWTKLSAESSP